MHVKREAMQHKSDVYTINNAAPPSYAEVTGQIPMRNNLNVSPPNQTTIFHNQGSTSMPDGVSPPTAPYLYVPNTFYSNIPTTTPYPIYPLNPQNPQNQFETTIPPNTIIASRENNVAGKYQQIASTVNKVIITIKREALLISFF